MFSLNRKIKHHRREDKEWMEDNWRHEETETPEWVAKMPGFPKGLSSVAAYAFPTALNYLYFNNDREKFLEYIRITHISRTWHWKGMFSHGPHHVQLPGGEPFTTGVMLPNIDVSLGTLIEGIYLALTLRDQGAMAVYRTIPFEPMRTRMGSDHQPFLHHWLNFLQTVGTDSPDIRRELDLAYELSAPSGDLTPLRVEWLNYVFRPFVLLWKPILDNDPDMFNKTLRYQQKSWKAFYSVKEDRRSDGITSFYPMPALAAVSYAYDLGFPVRVKSDYLPRFLVEGDFPRLAWPDPDWVK